VRAAGRECRLRMEAGGMERMGVSFWWVVRMIPCEQVGRVRTHLEPALGDHADPAAGHVGRGDAVAPDPDLLGPLEDVLAWLH
jgi:hypothetical protein